MASATAHKRGKGLLLKGAHNQLLGPVQQKKTAMAGMDEGTEIDQSTQGLPAPMRSSSSSSSSQQRRRGSTVGMAWLGATTTADRIRL